VESRCRGDWAFLDDVRPAIGVNIHKAKCRHRAIDGECQFTAITDQHRRASARNDIFFLGKTDGDCLLAALIIAPAASSMI
jgi:hypothetical protein